MKKRMLSLLLALTVCAALSVPANGFELSVRAGVGNTLAANGLIDGNGSLWMWGENEYGQIGNGGAYDKVIGYCRVQSAPFKVMDNVASVSCGNSFTAIVKTDGSVWGWGDNSWHELGNVGVGNSESVWGPIQTVPARVNNLKVAMPAAAAPQAGSGAAGGSVGFSDVPKGAYYADAVAWAVGKGITNGTSATAFSPDQTCTRAQIATFLFRAFGG